MVSPSHPVAGRLLVGLVLALFTLPGASPGADGAAGPRSQTSSDLIDGPQQRSRLRRIAGAMRSSQPAGGSARPAASWPPASCKVTMEPSRRAFNVATYFSWYAKESQFECMSAKPLEGSFHSKNRRRIRQHLRRLSENGFDAIAGVIYADPSDEGRLAKEMRWMRRAVGEVARHGLQFLPFYDFSIAVHGSTGLCNAFAGPCPPGSEPVTEYNFDRHPVLQDAVFDHLVMIADEFIVPFSDLDDPARGTIKFLHDSAGREVRDDAGRPRPEIYIYIPRVWQDDSDYATIREVLQRVEVAYRDRGLGTPAYTLDVLVPWRPYFDPELVAAFGDSAVRLTAFFAVDGEAENLGELARMQRKMYRRAARRLAQWINRGVLHPGIQIAGGSAVNFDKRAWAACHGGFGNVAWPALEPNDWLEALMTLIEHTAHPICTSGQSLGPQGQPYQSIRYLYADEGYESTWLCAEQGPVGQRYPNRYGCEPLQGFGELMRQLARAPRTGRG